MTEFSTLLQQGNSWLFIPTAVTLGALHGLEPGHSKTMMASFIIAIRGTVAQAVMLGVCAALSHSLIVWLLALLALRFGNALIAEQAEPYFMLVSSVIVLGVAIWMFMRTRWDNRAARVQSHAPHGGRMINTGHGFAELQIHEQGEAPRFRLHLFSHSMAPQPPDEHLTVTLETIRPDGSRQAFELQSRAAYWESVSVVPEPHEFEASLVLGHQGHEHRYEVAFEELEHHHHGGATDHGHAHPHEHAHSIGGASEDYQDAHERAHAEDIKRRFVGQTVTNRQIALFGLTGGLVPCPASVTVLMVCLHLKRVSLGVAMVASFSLGLALAMVSVGVAAAWGARQVGKRLGNLSAIARKTPYASSALMALVALVMGGQALSAIAH